MNDFTKNMAQALFNPDKINDLLRKELRQAVNDLLEARLMTAINDCMTFMTNRTRTFIRNFKEIEPDLLIL